jgi:hypothetical protein
MRLAAEQVCPAFCDAGVHEEGQRGVEVGVGEDELRALAAELQRHRHGVLRRGAWMSWPTCTEPVKEMWRTPGCAASAAPASSPGAGTDVQRPGGQARLLRDVGEGQRRAGRPPRRA